MTKSKRKSTRPPKIHRTTDCSSRNTGSRHIDCGGTLRASKSGGVKGNVGSTDRRGECISALQKGLGERIFLPHVRKKPKENLMANRTGVTLPLAQHCKDYRRLRQQEHVNLGICQIPGIQTQTRGLQTPIRTFRWTSSTRPISVSTLNFFASRAKVKNVYRTREYKKENTTLEKEAVCAGSSSGKFGG